MAKKVQGYVKLQVPAGAANPSPPIGPALGQQGVNIMEFCKQFNAQTQKLEKGLPIPVVITVYADRSFTLLRRDGVDAARWNLLHPDKKPRVPFVTQQLGSHAGPVVAASDYVRLFPEQIREFLPRRFVTLGTDGFGRSDNREGLRHFFEVDRRYVVIAALRALADEGQLDMKKAAEAIKKYGVNPEKPNPATA